MTGWTGLGPQCSGRRSEWTAEALVGFMDSEPARVSRWAEARGLPGRAGEFQAQTHQGPW